MKRRSLSRTSFLIALTMVLGLVPFPINVDASEESDLIITEITPNIAGPEDYEFVEMYNLTDSQVNLGDYQLEYVYTDDSKDSIFIEVNGEVESGEAVVLWHNKSDKLVEDFKRHFGVGSDDVQVIPFSSEAFKGMSNGGDRGFRILKEDTEMSFASYLGDEVAEDLSKHFKRPTDGMAMGTYATLLAATPGQVNVEQTVVGSGEENKEPTITHEKVESVDANQNIQVNAKIQDDQEFVTATLFYQASNRLEWKSKTMSTNDNENYTAEIPSESYLDSTIHYYIEVQDGQHTTTFPQDSSQPIEVTIASNNDTDFQTIPALLVTEITPDSKNIGGKDGYEFIEVYNNTNQEINIKDYQIFYQYPDGSKVEWDLTKDQMIPSQDSFVIWIHNGENDDVTVADFNANYGSSLEEDQVAVVEVAGMANGSERTIAVATDLGQVISSSSYNNGSEDVEANKGIMYKFPTAGSTMIKVGLSNLATPGTILNGQAPSQPVQVAEDDEPPVITHTPVDTIQSGEEVAIQASIVDNEGVQGALLSYGQKDAEGDWKSLQMEPVEEGSSNYEAVIPGDDTRVESLSYQIEASDGVNVERTEVFDVNVQSSQYDAQAIPPFLITEVVPDSTNVGGLDGYEFIEVYNNSDQPINFKDYKIRYRYPMEGPAADLLWEPNQEELIIPSGESVVFWIINSANQDETYDDFNENYGVDLEGDQELVKIYSNGMSNSSDRALLVATNTGHEVVSAYYNDEPNKKDPAANKGILYAFSTDGSQKMVKTSSGEVDASPGTAQGGQVPTDRVTIQEDSENPSVEGLSIPGVVDENKDLSLTFDATDNQEVKTVTLYYKNNEQSDYTKVDLEEDYDDGFYHHTIYSPELIGKETLEYVVVVSDGTNEITTSTNTVSIQGDQSEDGLRLNVKDGEVLTGHAALKATSTVDDYEDVSLFIDGNEVTNETYRSLETQAYFAFDVKKTNLYFKNGVTMGEETLHIFDDTINTYTTITVPIEPNRIEYGGETTISIRSGTKVSPFDQESEENRDDFYVKNVRLVLEDGTTVYDPTYSNPEQELSIGDGGASIPTVPFSFEVPEEQFTSKTYKWNTETAAEGEHTFSARVGEEEQSAKVVVDRTAPTITSSVNEGEEYKGDITIDASIEDQWSEVTDMKATLDGEAIELLFETSSASLNTGEHVFEVVATDLVGNESTETIRFEVVEEKPYAPTLVSPQEEATGVSTDATLRVRVQDPTDDQLSVQFLEGYTYQPLDEEIRAYSYTAPTEPPNVRSAEGENLLTTEDVNDMAENDQTYYTTNSTDEFPYHRFEVEVDDAVADQDLIELNWEGKSIVGRKVSMYVWNVETNEWDLQQWKVAEEDDFTLTSRVQAEKYLDNQRVNVLIQDEIKKDVPFDYTLVWMSDTQYYSESYPYIYERMVNWVADHKEALKIPYVFHTGDLVDEWDDQEQWNYADDYMKVLEEADIPYGVLAGNHDVDQKNNDYSQYSKYFGEDRFESESYYGESYKDNRGHYDLISVNGNDFLMMYMGWGVTDEDIAWMNGVLEEHPNRMVFLNFHEYLLVSGNRSPLGNKLYEQVVKPNENVVAVLSGHYHDSETLIDEIDDDGDGETDRKVYQMLADYQGGPEGGQGYLRLLHVNPNENKIYVKTYSPYMEDYNYYNPEDYPGKDEFVIDLPLQPKEKQVATDAFYVNVYTDESIGEEQTVDSNDEVSVDWERLEEETNYSWYVRVTDDFGGEVISDVWSFTTGEEKRHNRDEDDDDDDDRSSSRDDDDEEEMEVDIPGGPVIEWEKQENVDVNKTWNIAFNLSIDEDTVDAETIFVVDEDGDVVDADIELEDDGKRIEIDPDRKLKKGETYTLWITTGVESNGVKMEKPIKFEFETKD